MSASPRGPGPALRFPRRPAEGGCCRSLRPAGSGPGASLRKAGNVWPHLALITTAQIKEPRAQWDRWQLPSELKPLGELRSSRILGRRGEAEKDLGAITGALGHSEVSDSRASADRSARSRDVCAGSRAEPYTGCIGPRLGGPAGHPGETTKGRGS